MAQHLIFEGAELSGKSWVMAQIYKRLEPAGATSSDVLNGCYWFNCDLGFFGTAPAGKILKNYLKIFKTLKDKNIILEKFQVSAAVYGDLYDSPLNHFKKIEKRLKKLNFKIILLTFPVSRDLIAKRLQDRLNLYPAYGRIAKSPEWYLEQQAQYLEIIKKSKLDYLVLEVAQFPNEEIIHKIETWSENNLNIK